MFCGIVFINLYRIGYHLKAKILEQAKERSFNGHVLVEETRYALSEESYVSPRAVGYSSCVVAFYG